MITIGIPVYQQVDFLVQAIESALNQTVPCEIIICDDGSNDGSEKIVNDYNKDPRIKIIHQCNKGLASARNSIIMNMTGDFFLPLDSDDILQENAVERIQEIIKQNPDADIIAPSFKCFGLSQEEVILMPNPTLEDFKTANRIAYCAAIRKSALLEVGGYSPRMVEGYEDLHLWVNLLSTGKKIITIPEVLWKYRIKEKSMYRDITPEIHKKLIAQINKDFPQCQLTF